MRMKELEGVYTNAENKDAQRRGKAVLFDEIGQGKEGQRIQEPYPDQKDDKAEAGPA